MKNQNVEKPFVDIVSSYNNGVFAVYIIGKDVLEAESRSDLLGVPFLAWNGSWTPIGPSVERARQMVGVPYISKDQMKLLENGMVKKGDVPETITISGTEYSIDRLASSYVPFSFSIFHESDEKEGRRIRTLSDFDNLVDNVFPQVAKVRAHRASIKAKDNQLVNRILASVGLYKPSSFDGYQPVSTL